MDAITEAKRSLWLAAATEGLYVVGPEGRTFRAIRLLEVPRGWIDDLARDGEMVHILSGRTIYSIALQDWTWKNVSEAVTNAGAGTGKENDAATRMRRNEDPVRPASTEFYSEEARFMRQLERYLKK